MKNLTQSSQRTLRMKLINSIFLFPVFLCALSGLCVKTTFADAPPTFTRDIAPIVFSNCSLCHRTGEAAPFNLLTYDDVKKHAKQIVKVTASRYMPPWKAEHSPIVHFMNERRLTDKQIALFEAWQKADMPEGDARALPPLPKFAEGWQLGTPDMILKMPESYSLYAEGRDVFRAFVVPIPVTTTKYVRAVEFRPGNPKILHHSLFFLDDQGRARKMDEKDPDVGYRAMGGVGFMPSGSLGGWSVGAIAVPYPTGVSHPIKPGTDLVLQTHMHPDGKPETEQSTIGLYFSDKPPTKLMLPLTLLNRNIDIPAGEKAFTLTSELTVPVNVDLVGITPHAHQVCKSMLVTATFPATGKTETLINVADWDFNWQEQYRLAAPLPLPKGTIIKMTYTYDNSADNPRNPSSPPKRITFGEQSTDEMAFCFMQVIAHDLSDIKPIFAATFAQRQSSGLIDRLFGNKKKSAN